MLFTACWLKPPWDRGNEEMIKNKKHSKICKKQGDRGQGGEKLSSGLNRAAGQWRILRLLFIVMLVFVVDFIKSVKSIYPGWV